MKTKAEGKIGIVAHGSAKKPLSAEESSKLVHDIMEKYQIGKTDAEKKVESKPKARLDNMTEKEKRDYIRRKAIEAKKKKEE